MASDAVFERIAAFHMGHMDVCDLLEEIADALPQRIDPGTCQSAAEKLGLEISVHRRDQEEGLFPLLRERALPSDEIEPWLRQLCSEHIADEGNAMEIAEMLPHLAADGPMGNADACGYMLRAFFEGFRRHLCWEQHLILPLARARLTADDLERVEAQMRLRRSGLPF